MKKYLVFAAVLTVLVLVSGCDLLGLGEETWSYSIDMLGYEYCAEVTTNDADLKDALEAAGYDQEPCDIDDVGSCTISDLAGFSQYDVEFTYFYGGLYETEGAEEACELLDGEWND